MDDLITKVLLSVGWDTIPNGIVATAKLIQLAQYKPLAFAINCIDFYLNFLTNIGPSRL